MVTIAAKVGELHVASGCYVDGHHGQYAYDVLAQVADMLLGTEYAEPLMEARQADDFDTVVSIADEVLDALNEATTGGYWEWHDGEVFLTSEDEDEFAGL